MQRFQEVYKKARADERKKLCNNSIVLQVGKTKVPLSLNSGLASVRASAPSQRSSSSGSHSQAACPEVINLVSDSDDVNSDVDEKALVSKGSFSFVDTLTVYGYSHVNQLRDVSEDFLRSTVGIPAYAIMLVLDGAECMAHSAEKGKGKAVIDIDVDEDEDMEDEIKEEDELGL